jgi:transglutaminase-like putative cysteine protease
LAEHGLSGGLPGAINQARRWEKLVTFALLLMLLTTAAAGVTSVLSGPDWGSLWTSLFFGLLTGWALAVFRQPAWRFASVAVVAGLIYTLFSTGGLGGKAMALLAVFIRLNIHEVIFPQGLIADWIQLVHLVQELFTVTGVIFGRVRAWAVGLAGAQSYFDPVAAALVWGFLVWIVAAWAGWVVEGRRNALVAISPAVLLSAGALSYGRRDSVTVYLMLGMALILLATVQHDRREQEWDENGVAYPAKKGRQIGSVAAITALALVLFAALVSWISFQRIVDWLALHREPTAKQSGGLAKSLGIFPAVTSPPDAFEAVRFPGLPRDLLIGSGPELSRRLVMTVAVTDLASLSQKRQFLPFYWRSFAYDVYTGHGWRTTQTQDTLYQANDPLQSDQAADHILIQQIVNPVEGAGGIVYAAGEPVSVNLESDAARRSPGDLFGIRLNGTGSYTVRSLIPVIDERTLRTAGQAYPDWVRQRYLDLPPEVPDRVKDLAIRLTIAKPTSYDRAKAVESYLRTYPYTLNVTRPPSDRDLVDYFLFDLGQGYCDYYASAMVVLARAAGIPARLAIGYASGTYNLNSKRFVVSKADAHSWVEIYFPGIGWVPFEPTASRPALEPQQQSAPAAPDVAVSPQPPPGAARAGPAKWGWSLPLIVLALAGALISAGVVFDNSRLNRLPEPAAAIEIYRRLRRHGALFSVPLEAGDTPSEFAASLVARLEELARQGAGQAFRPLVIGQVETLTERIVRASYRPSQLQTAGGSPLIHQWQTIRWQLRRLWLLNSWKSLRDRLISSLAGSAGQSIAGGKPEG